MDFFEKPPIRKFQFYARIILMTILLCLSLLMVLSALAVASQYESAKDNALTLEAEIIRVDVQSDSEGSDTYWAVMRYKYRGVSYEGDYKSFGNERDARALVGQIVTIQVDPADPADTLDELLHNGRFGIAMACIFLGLGLACGKIRYRQTYAETYGWRRETVKKDILQKLWRKSLWQPFLAAELVYIGAAAMYPGVYLNIGMVVIFLLVGVIGMVSLIRYLRDIRLVREDRFRLTRDRFVSKRIVTDSEDPDKHLITYTNGSETWEKQVSYKHYASADSSDTIESAYLEGHKRPILNYSHHDGVD